MKPSRTIAKLFIIFSVAALFLTATTRTANTYPLFVNRAKQLGYPAQNCTYCHTQARGGIGHNERGRWLIAEKGRRRANSVDVAWLSNYKPAAKGKARR
jgi:mono/diheme cytochrome c family protein